MFSISWGRIENACSVKLIYILQYFKKFLKDQWTQKVVLSVDKRLTTIVTRLLISFLRMIIFSFWYGILFPNEKENWEIGITVDSLHFEAVVSDSIYRKDIFDTFPINYLREMVSAFRFSFWATLYLKTYKEKKKTIPRTHNILKGIL